jgi:hypothetical protein
MVFPPLRNGNVLSGAEYFLMESTDRELSKTALQSVFRQSEDAYVFLAGCLVLS